MSAERRQPDRAPRNTQHSNDGQKIKPQMSPKRRNWNHRRTSKRVGGIGDNQMTHRLKNYR
jgi:hypothetical protein